ncbi:uncharacterized protein BXZ73DRAFT_106819 [Epithele typhae]|uniref:uncharacterized protein n=1 Tax=Epithele typhae TaxID=378194 RepID=UPI002007E3BE|nr:uncharacterized protein BXZ73DRAFT_106819 [Epithele typhae]KAH9913795.1 hypothetical protein BXZ73DRAFT_106819 [Epithele typhae]
MAYRLPARGAAGAPSFDPEGDPRTILGFFDDLDYCFEQGQINDEDRKKAHAVRYAPDSEKTIWRAIPEFTDATKDYEDFKKAVKKEYVGEDGVGLFTRRDLELLVDKTASQPIESINTFNKYGRLFRDRSAFLVLGNQLQPKDRDHLFLLGLPLALRTPILDRLRIIKPTILYPRDPYPINDVTEAAHHVLEAALVGTVSGSSLVPTQVVAPVQVPAIKSEATMVMEQLAATLSPPS